jgi:hypothetical protein
VCDKKGEVFNDKTKTCSCPDGQYFNGKECACPYGQIFDGKHCVENCGKDAHFDSQQKKCVCNKKGQVFDDKTKTCKCPGNQYWDGNKCACPYGSTWDNGKQTCKQNLP